MFVRRPPQVLLLLDDGREEDGPGHSTSSTDSSGIDEGSQVAASTREEQPRDCVRHYQYPQYWIPARIFNLVKSAHRCGQLMRSRFPSVKSISQPF